MLLPTNSNVQLATDLKEFIKYILENGLFRICILTWKRELTVAAVYVNTLFIILSSSEYGPNLEQAVHVNIVRECLHVRKQK